MYIGSFLYTLGSFAYMQGSFTCMQGSFLMYMGLSDEVYYVLVNVFMALTDDLKTLSGVYRALLYVFGSFARKQGSLICGQKN